MYELKIKNASGQYVTDKVHNSLVWAVKIGRGIKICFGADWQVWRDGKQVAGVFHR